MKHKWLLFLIIPISAFADQLLMSNITNGCSNNFSPNTYLRATFRPNQYQCNSGYYVPANNDGCVVCPEYYDCNGGNFTFNEEYDQGNKFKTIITEDITDGCREDFTRAYNNSANIMATFTPNVHNCNSGYYLQANVDSCTICPAGNKCVGGTYSFNEKTDQGIESCNGLFAPVGSSVCYEHKLHIGNESIYLSSTKHTTPSLNVAYGNNVYYANMTTVPTVMTAGSSHYFKTIYNNTEYYICDNTSCPQ